MYLNLKILTIYLFIINEFKIFGQSSPTGTHTGLEVYEHLLAVGILAAVVTSIGNK